MGIVLSLGQTVMPGGWMGDEADPRHRRLMKFATFWLYTVPE